MADAHHFLALDLGAESGRGIIVTLDGERAEMEEIHRWTNRPVRVTDTLYWDLPFLFAEITEALRLAGESGKKISGISVDTWGVDFGLLGSDGKLLSNPVNYRDSRTDNIHEYSNKTMTTGEIFALTGYEPWAISSLFQLLSMKRDDSPLLGVSDAFLNMPDLMTYLLTGRKVNEMSIVNTSNLMGLDCAWCDEIINRFDLAGEMFGEMVSPATVIGPLRDSLAAASGLDDTPVISTCGHDTSAAVAAVPAEGDNWAFISCGTWSILGSLIDKPVPTPRCLELGFTNEYTIGGWYLARNISGLWLVQQLKRKWDRSDEPWDYGRMAAEAAKVKTEAMVDVADDSLLAPDDMEDALMSLISAGGQKAPQGRAELVRCVLESLALEYNWRLDALAELTGKRAQAVYIVGGGIRNELLCQLTADACGVPAHAGADQCTAMGNGLGQALALGILEDREQIRHVMRQSFETRAYEPRDADLWREKRKAYDAVQNRGR